MNVDDYKDFTREQLVEEYLETRLATFVDACGVDRRWMPTDVSMDPVYWKSKDKSLHDMHYEIARRYHIDRYDCLWLENIADTDNLYLMHYKFKPIVKKAIELLEQTEKEKLDEKNNDEEK
jgi:hypothetical protein